MPSGRERRECKFLSYVILFVTVGTHSLLTFHRHSRFVFFAPLSFYLLSVLSNFKTLSPASPSDLCTAFSMDFHHRIANTNPHHKSGSSGSSSKLKGYAMR